MAWKTRPSGKRYLYISHWSSDKKKSVTRYIPLADVDETVKAVARTAELSDERRALKRKAEDAWRGALAAQRQERAPQAKARLLLEPGEAQ